MRKQFLTRHKLGGFPLLWVNNRDKSQIPMYEILNLTVRAEIKFLSLNLIIADFVLAVEC